MGTIEEYNYQEAFCKLRRDARVAHTAIPIIHCIFNRPFGGAFIEEHRHSPKMTNALRNH